MTDRALITGGAGFVGTNLADRLLRAGTSVALVDDMSRPGVRANLEWLVRQHPRGLTVHEGDVRDATLLRRALDGVDSVFHLAAQVAVTTSLEDPQHDFGVNLQGTLTVLECVRRRQRPPRLLFTSTNKVYGALDDVELRRRGDRYEPVDETLRLHGVSEERPLAFCSPYGCSKGGADQYVIDYAKSFGVPSVVFRMSCIYGPHQQGNEDQGWVAHFLKQVMAGRPVTLYGDGAQVRDVLFVEDLLDAMLLAMSSPATARGSAFNIGGGPANTVSLLELLGMIHELTGVRPQVEQGAWRAADQRWFVSDTRCLQEATGWTQRTAVRDGVRRLHAWLRHGTREAALAEVG